MPRMLLACARAGLGIVFLYAAYTKLLVWNHVTLAWRPWMLLAFSIDSYHLLPERGVIILARGLPWVELVLGVLLLTGYKFRWVAAAATTLLLAFFAVMLRAHLQGLGIDCGCFGFGEKLGVRTLVRDGFLVAVSLALTLAAFLRGSARHQATTGGLEQP
jgi:putative oxidoreductase